MPDNIQNALEHLISLTFNSHIVFLFPQQKFWLVFIQARPASSELQTSLNLTLNLQCSVHSGKVWGTWDTLVFDFVSLVVPTWYIATYTASERGKTIVAITHNSLLIDTSRYFSFNIEPRNQFPPNSQILSVLSSNFYIASPVFYKGSSGALI